MDTTGSVRVSLELEQATPIQGHIHVGDHRELPFYGWLELVAALRRGGGPGGADRGRGMDMLRYSMLAVVALAVLPAAAGAHPERTTTYPDPSQGSVPEYRTSGPALVVCKDDSRELIRRAWRGRGPKTTRARRRALRLARRCRFEHIQQAVDAAGNGTRILVMPGVYREEPSRREPVADPRCKDFYEVPDDGDEPLPTFAYQRDCPLSRNLIAIIGDSDSDGRCDAKCDLQLEGRGRRPEDVLIVGDRLKKDVIRADRADGVVISNLAVEQAAYNGIDVVETNGFRLQHIVARWSQAYGILSFTSDHGLYDHIEAYGNGDSGVYPGSGPEGHCERYGIEVRNVNSYGNTMGYSGTAGNGTWVHHSRFHHNTIGISTDSVVPGHPGMPQDCSRYEDNDVYSNNLNLYEADDADYCARTKFEDRRREFVCPQFLVPVGTGLTFFGANDNVIARNRFWDNWRQGTFQVHGPAVVRGELDPLKQYDTSHGNRYSGNRMGVDPEGRRDPNGIDFYWDGEGARNCWEDNRGAGDAAPTSEPPELPLCPGGTFGLGDPIVARKIVPCTTWDPQDNPRPAGCDWYVTPEEPS